LAEVVDIEFSLSFFDKFSKEIPTSKSVCCYSTHLQWVWNGVHSALVRINEELLEIKVAAPV
jgi:hypothetical protein